MEKKIAKNVSSGAKKVEKIEADNAYTAAKVDGQKHTKKPVPKKTQEPVKKAERAKERERAAAEKRVETAKQKAQKKEEKLMRRAKLKEQKIQKAAALKEKKIQKRAALQQKRAERIALREKRRAELKEKKLKIKADREARREILKNESKTERQRRIAREKKERIALQRKRHEAKERARENRAKQRSASKERRAENKRHKREQRTERQKQQHGVGGWIAAVVSLGVASLALATVVTAGAVRMSEMNLATANSYRSTLYEMVSVSEDMDDSLAKLRVSSGEEEQRKLLTDLLVDSSLMESALERVPVDQVTATDISSYVNRTGMYARMLLDDLAAGKKLSETQKNTIASLSEINAKLYGELNNIVMHMNEKDFRAFLKGKESEMQNGFKKAGQEMHAGSREALDAPFAGQGNIGHNRLEAREEVSEERSAELVKKYFANYHVKDVHMTGETHTHGIRLYNYILTDEDDNEIYAEVSANGGELMFFDTYEICTQKNFELETCDKLAREYLSSLGIENVEASYLSDTGMVANITYVGVQDGVRVYPEAIKVRVCESKGRVVGMDASQYLFNHFNRTIEEPKLSEKQAMQKLSSALDAYEGHLVVAIENGKETLAYEFACHAQDETYLVYIDATSGEEIALYRVREGNGGKFIR